jgi:predicted SnoaL-like aldol condensation-catalyzing enzyme
MQASKTHVAIALTAGGLLLIIFFGYIHWLNNQGPVLARSEERDPLTNMPISITMNPLRDRTIERTASAFIVEMRDGNCRQLLVAWEKDYRRKRAQFICDSESQHPLIGWNIVEWEDAPPLVILHYKGKRYSTPAQSATYEDLFSITEEKKSDGWTVTKYDSFY